MSRLRLVLSLPETLVLVVFDVVPGHALLNHGEVHVLLADHHMPHRPPDPSYDRKSCTLIARKKSGVSCWGYYPTSRPTSG